MHSRLGSTTLSQLAFPGESNLNFPWEKFHLDDTVVKKKKKRFAPVLLIPTPSHIFPRFKIFFSQLPLLVMEDDTQVDTQECSNHSTTAGPPGSYFSNFDSLVKRNHALL